MTMRLYEGMPILERSTAKEYPAWLRQAQQQGAFLLLDKPRGWTSFDAVAFLRRLLALRRIGHAGTLDPLATGLLILGVGRATRMLSHFQKLPKTYTTTLKLGAITETDDAEAPEQPICSSITIGEEEFRRILERFRGTLEQVPPRYSAVKYRGRRLYELSRAGITVMPQPRTVHIYQLELLRFDPPFVSLQVSCSAGTYIRALARDIGMAAGCGAYVLELRRLAIGPYHVENALTPEEFARLVSEHARVHQPH